MTPVPNENETNTPLKDSGKTFSIAAGELIILSNMKIISKPCIYVVFI